MEIKRFGVKQRMSAVNEHNGVLYFAGKVTPDTSVSAAEQTKLILDALERLLNEHGSDKNHVLSALIHLHDFSDFDAMNSVWDEWIDNGNAPARTCVGGVMMDGNPLVEITITAAKK